MIRRPAAAATIVVALAALAGCTAGDVDDPDPSGIALPPVGATPDYQLGGAYDPAADVEVVARDRLASPVPGIYSICYVNGFQTQPGELEDWPDEVLLQRDGAPVFDPGWPDEALLDTSTSARRERIAEIVIPWIDGCAEAGFDGVEFDNLDSFSRSDDALAFDDNLALAVLLVDAAHDAGLAAGQKNGAEHAAAFRERAGFDFAVTEECAVFEECDDYTEVYGEHVIDIEYADALPRSLAEMCADPDSPSSMVLRDRDLTTPGHDEYVFETCATPAP